jgi:LysR family transcriptional regulator, hydrogen peroxide-inducible genes activator
MVLPSTRQLRYFVALAEQGHFGRAAGACHVSQSAFSGAIQEFETLLGAQLVDRTNRRVTITALGAEVATQARLCLRDIESLVDSVRSASAPLAGYLRLGVIPTIAPFLLPRALPKLRKSLPKLRLYLYEGTTADVRARLQRGELDAILLALPYELGDVESAVLFRDPFRLACRDGTKLVDPKQYRFSRLDSQVVLLLEDGHCLRDHAISACKLKDQRKLSPFAASSLMTLIGMVDADLGVTFLPAMAEGSALLKGSRVRTYPLADGSYREIALVWRRGSGRAAEFRTLAAELRKAGQGAGRDV